MADRNRENLGTQSPNRNYLNTYSNLCCGKNYAYRVIANEGKKTLRKVRYITLNYHASKLVNFVVIRAMFLKQGEPIVTVYTEHKMKPKRRAGGR